MSKTSTVSFESRARNGSIALGIHALGGTWRCDWSVEFPLTATGPASLTTGEYRTNNDMIPNEDQLGQVRSVLAGELAQGPRLRLAEEPPQLRRRLHSIPLTATQTTFADDYCDQTADHSGLNLPLDAPGFDLAKVLGQHLFRCRDEVWGITAFLATDGDPTGGTAQFRADPQVGWTVSFTAPAASDPVAIQRWRTQQLALLNRIKTSLGASQGARLRAHIDRERTGTPNPQWVPAWDADTPTPQLLINQNLDLPVAIKVRTSARPSLLLLASRAAEAAAPRRRLHTSGLTTASRQKNLTLLTRGPALLAEAPNTKLPFIRYCGRQDSQQPVLSLIAAEGAPFWEVEFAARGDQTRDYTLVLTGLSRTLDVVCYGAELASFLDAYVALLQTADPDAEVHTLYLCLGTPR